jgi:hypothetical protein
LRKLTNAVVTVMLTGIVLIGCAAQQQAGDEEPPPAPTEITPVEVPLLGSNPPPEVPLEIDDERYPLPVPSGMEFEQAQALYEMHCAECHGIEGEGQQPDPNAPGMAPPHNESGHTWHHPDQQNFATVWLGTANMPAFHDTLTAEEILFVLGYIKHWWGDSYLETQEGRTLSLINNPPTN